MRSAVKLTGCWLAVSVWEAAFMGLLLLGSVNRKAWCLLEFSVSKRSVRDGRWYSSERSKQDG